VHLDRWRLEPSAIVTDTFSLNDAAAAYELADRGTSGKVVITFP
jgi:threonine dehydrogenase-like Zn-dependent dehydrogenase